MSMLYNSPNDARGVIQQNYQQDLMLVLKCDGSHTIEYVSALLKRQAREDLHSGDARAFFVLEIGLV